MYDLTELREMSDNDEEFVQEMIHAFLKNNKDYLNTLNEGLAAKDWKVVKFNAHKIKPSILLFKITSLKQVILDINEFAGNEINLDKVPNLVEKLNEGLSLVFNKISEEII
ncbi:MAG: Hpt domain-containing protein [Salibacteraceae bacterium]